MDLISNVLTRIRNAIHARQTKVQVKYSKMIERMMEILQAEGYIRKFQIVEEDKQRMIRAYLRFDPAFGYAIRELKRVSKPSQRVYCRRDGIPSMKNGLGISILSTSKGVMTGEAAKHAGVGGEIICTVF